MRFLFTLLSMAFVIFISQQNSFSAENAFSHLLTNQQNWSRFSGTVWKENHLNVIPLNRKIRPKSDTQKKWYLNPPVNLSGPRLEVKGDFTVQMEIETGEHPEKYAAIDLYGTLPIDYDEWRVDGRNIRFKIANGKVEIFANMEKLSFSEATPDKKIVLTLSRQNSILLFSVNGKQIGTFDDTETNPVFLKNQLYFGADAEPGGGFKILNIDVKGAVVHDNFSELIKSYPVPKNTLRSSASSLKSPVFIATAANVSALTSDPQYGKILAENFSMITPELDFKFQTIHPLADQYAFAEADTLVDFAQKNHIKIHGHTLVWHEALPEWIWNLYQTKKYNELHSALMNHIQTIVSRYKGIITEWDTLNEIFTDDSREKFGLRSEAEEQDNISIWYKAFGIQIYIDALKLVKQIDPHCENWINEFGINQDGSKKKLKNMIAFVNYVNKLGYGQLIDGIGFQAHDYDPSGDPSPASELKTAMERVMKEAHIKTRISELDVNGATKFPDFFHDKLAVCLKLNCSSFSMWGFTDRFGSMSSAENKKDSGTNYQSPNWSAEFNDALIFDENYRPKKPYELLLQTLDNF